MKRHRADAVVKMSFGKRLEALGLLATKSFSQREGLLRYQSRRLTFLVRYAAENVAYYRRLFEKSGFDPRHFRGLQDLQQIPISSKDDLLSCPPEDLISRRMRVSRLLERTTSGSTGRPFQVRCTRFEERYLSTLRLRIYMKMGLKIGDRVAHIRFLTGASGDESWLRCLGRLGILRITRINSSLSQFEITRRLEEIQPDVIEGYCNLTSITADAAEQMGMRIRPRIVIVGGDVLTPKMRHRIAEAFQTQVRETFGSHECNLMAWECRESGLLHVWEEGVILEIVNDGLPVRVGERGEVVVTALHSFAQPFLRYRLGDIATRGPQTCNCGLPYSTIRSIDGRIYDRIILSDGRAASPGDVLSRLEQKSDWIKQYQMIQESSELVVLRLVPKRIPEAGDLAAIHEMMERFLSPGMQHRIDLLEQIPHDRRGKYRASFSKVFSNYADAPENEE